MAKDAELAAQVSVSSFTSVCSLSLLRCRFRQQIVWETLILTIDLPVFVAELVYLQFSSWLQG